MILSKKTLEKLRKLINEETEYRSGPKLIEFFSNLGFSDTYGQGFPSRWKYTDDKLSIINGTPDLDKCIKSLFAPVNFIGNFDKLENIIKDFNQYLAFDGWKINIDGREILFSKVNDFSLNINTEESPEIGEDDFLNKEFEEISIEKLKLEPSLTNILNLRLDEIKKCINIKASLSSIFLCGSTLEGILLGYASKYPKEFNKSASSPKDREGKVKQFQEWTLSNLIEVSYEVGFLKEDVKKFSHSLREFRNYIHPYQQVASNFNPDEHTAKICWQVLKTAIYQLSKIQHL